MESSYYSSNMQATRVFEPTDITYDPGGRLRADHQKDGVMIRMVCGYSIVYNRGCLWYLWGAEKKVVFLKTTAENLLIITDLEVCKEWVRQSRKRF